MFIVTITHSHGHEQAQKAQQEEEEEEEKKKDRGLPSLIESKSAVIPLQFHESGIFSKQVKGQIG